MLPRSTVTLLPSWTLPSGVTTSWPLIALVVKVASLKEVSCASCSLTLKLTSDWSGTILNVRAAWVDCALAALVAAGALVAPALGLAAVVALGGLVGPIVGFAGLVTAAAAAGLVGAAVGAEVVVAAGL